MATSYGINFRNHEEHVDLSAFPATTERKSSLVGGLFVSLFALVWGGFPLYGLLTAEGLERSEMIIMVIFPAIGFGLLLFGIHLLLWRKEITFDETGVDVVERGLFGTKTWWEPLSAYRGVLRFTRRIRRKNSSYTLYAVDLAHDERNREIRLFQSRSDKLWRKAWEYYAHRLNLPALERGDEGEVQRDAADLDKSLADLVREGKVKIEKAPIAGKLEGVTLEREGKTLIVTRTGPINPWWGQVLAVLFPLVFVGFGFLHPEAPFWVAAMGIFFEVIFLWGVIHDLTTRDRLRVNRKEVARMKVSRSGEGKAKTLMSSEVETVSIGGDGKQKGRLVISADSGEIRFGANLPSATLKHLRNAVISEIPKA
jgi:hypothetical protein